MKLVHPAPTECGTRSSYRCPLGCAHYTSGQGENQPFLPYQYLFKLKDLLPGFLKKIKDILTKNGSLKGELTRDGKSKMELKLYSHPEIITGGKKEKFLK